MNPLKRFHLLILYAKDYWFYATIITVIVLYFTNKYGTGPLTVLIWFKLIATAIGIAVHQDRKTKEIHFYMNNGIGKPALITYTLLADMGFWILSMTLLIRFTL